MDTSTLHAVTEELAALLSEVTRGDLGRRTPYESMDVGDMYLYLNDQNTRVAAAVAGEPVARIHRTAPADRAALGASLDVDGGGLDVGYRRTAQIMEGAFASVTTGDRLRRVDELHADVEVADLYEMHVGDSVLHTWDMAQALGFSYLPAPDIAWRLLRGMLARQAATQRNGAGTLDDSDVFGCALTLSGRAS